jgi:hypothetical protein
MTSHDSGGRYPFFPGATLIQVVEAVEAAVAVADKVVAVGAMIQTL